MTTDTSMMSLREALDHTYRTRWAHTRDGGKCLMSQAQTAVQGVVYQARLRLAGHYSLDPNPRIAVGDVTPRDIHEATREWYSQGIAPATINKRLNCLSALGVKVEGLRRKPPKALKWFLSEDKREEVLNWLSLKPAGPGFYYHTLAEYIVWTTRTGLRVEETLKLTRSDFVWKRRMRDGEPVGGKVPLEVKVPGTKTAESQATLPLGGEACHSATMAFGVFAAIVPNQPLFYVTYEQLNAVWQEVRKAFGWEDNPTATLKALRRSAARYLHVDCGMPLDMVRQYLRHEDIKTTMEYLRLTGGYNTEEMRRYLK